MGERNLKNREALMTAPYQKVLTDGQFKTLKRYMVAAATAYAFIMIGVLTALSAEGCTMISLPLRLAKALRFGSVASNSADRYWMRDACGRGVESAPAAALSGTTRSARPVRAGGTASR